MPIYLLQGLGRSCFEGTNKALYADLFPNDALLLPLTLTLTPTPTPTLTLTKALYADLFPNDAAAAFSNIVIFNGGASAAAYFIFPLLAVSY